jgi:hypothetical protein
MFINIQSLPIGSEFLKKVFPRPELIVDRNVFCKHDSFKNLIISSFHVFSRLILKLGETTSYR